MFGLKSIISLTNFDLTGPSICPGGISGSPRYSGQASGLGSAVILNSLLSTRGIVFQPNVYSISSFFVFDNEGNSLTEMGILADEFPTFGGFVMFYGVELNDPTIPIYSVGLIRDDGELYLREYEPTTTEVNRIELSLTNDYYYTVTPTPREEQALADFTDEIFSGGTLYAFDFPQDNVFRLFNPCNRYEIFLVR